MASCLFVSWRAIITAHLHLTIRSLRSNKYMKAWIQSLSTTEYLCEFGTFSAPPRQPSYHHHRQQCLLLAVNGRTEPVHMEPEVQGLALHKCSVWNTVFPAISINKDVISLTPVLQMQISEPRKNNAGLPASHQPLPMVSCEWGAKDMNVKKPDADLG